MKKLTDCGINFTVIIILIIMGIAPAAFSQKANWTKFKSEQAKAEISFPSSFSESKEEKVDITTYKIMSQINDNVFFFSYSIHTNQLNDEYKLAQVSLDAFAEAINGKIINQEEYKVKDGKGIKSQIEMDGEMIATYLVIIKNQIQYQVVAATSKEKTELKISKKFIKSFKIK
ncbi:MAG: hypothetical protein K9J13_10085 [Saprospiraceae bacterium]|nr:hypothetical protein [Saprospiraceae bacterium]